MKRYSLDIGDRCMKELSDGGYVKFSDHEKEVAEKDRAMEYFGKEVMELRDLTWNQKKNVEHLESRIKMLTEVIQDFINKVESGRARSTDSYDKFKKALSEGEGK